MSIRSPQCSTCLDGRPYARCPGLKNCARIAILERVLSRVEKEMEEFVESGDLATPKWMKKQLRVICGALKR